jgi:hypothetical protein
MHRKVQQESGNDEALQEALEEADELRKRLATAAKYYDNRLSGLQTEVAQLKQQQLKSESDRLHQLALLQQKRELEVKELKMRLCQKDSLIAQMRKEKSLQRCVQSQRLVVQG